CTPMSPAATNMAIGPQLIPKTSDARKRAVGPRHEPEQECTEAVRVVIVKPANTRSVRASTAGLRYQEDMSDGLIAAGLLVVSNTFMTTAWYGHLRFKGLSRPVAILLSLGIASF